MILLRVGFVRSWFCFICVLAGRSWILRSNLRPRQRAIIIRPVTQRSGFRANEAALFPLTAAPLLPPFVSLFYIRCERLVSQRQPLLLQALQMMGNERTNILDVLSTRLQL